MSLASRARPGQAPGWVLVGSDSGSWCLQLHVLGFAPRAVESAGKWLFLLHCGFSFCITTAWCASPCREGVKSALWKQQCSSERRDCLAKQHSSVLCSLSCTIQSLMLESHSVSVLDLGLSLRCSYFPARKYQQMPLTNPTSASKQEKIQKKQIHFPA